MTPQDLAVNALNGLLQGLFAKYYFVSVHRKRQHILT